MQPYREERPWGQFERFTENETSTVKIITLKAGESTSLQYHNHRDEFWRVLSGTPVLTINGNTQHGTPGQEFFVPRGEKHRLGGGEQGGQILEIATGDFEEEDIVRLEDQYGRA